MNNSLNTILKLVILQSVYEKFIFDFWCAIDTLTHAWFANKFFDDIDMGTHTHTQNPMHPSLPKHQLYEASEFSFPPSPEEIFGSTV